MRHVAILLTASMLLTGCEQELSKNKIELLEAVMFAVNGIENNTQVKYRLSWKRKIVGQTIEYVTFGNNSYGFSNPETNAKTKDSSFVRYTRKISSPETCVFYMQSVEEYSKGDSKEDFSAFAGGHEDDILYLRNAYRFEMIYDLQFHMANIYLEGPAVVCDLKGSCQNAYMQRGS